MIIAEVIPYVGVGELQLGARREELRSRFNGRFRESKKSGSDVDQFLNANFMAYYDEDRRCTCLEFYVYVGGEAFYPAIGSQILLGVAYSTVLRALQEADPDIALDSAGFTSPKFGIGVYIDGPQEDPLVEGVSVYSRDSLP